MTPPTTPPTTQVTSEQPKTRSTPRAATMKAIVKAAAGPGAEVRDVPVPACGAGELLLKVKRAGVCGTDLHIYEWDRWSQGRIKPPVTLGHEFVGEVLERGAGVTEFAVGDRVSCESHIVCQHCTACRTGNAHVCANTRILGVDVNGGFAEMVAVPAVNAWRAPANIAIEVAAVMEPLGNAVHTAFAGPLSGCHVAITGCGPIGLFAIGVARAAGAARVFASDVSPYRLDLARKMQADAVIDVSRGGFVERVMELTDGQGLDGVLEMSGNPTAVRDALTAIGVQGATVSEVKGFGRQKGQTEIYRGAEYAVNFLPKTKIEVAVPTDRIDKVVEAIVAAAKTGQIGDGKIFVTDISQAVRIRTGETDTDAL